MRVLLVTSGREVSEQVMTALDGSDALSVDEVWTPQRALALLDDPDRAYDIVVADNDTTPTGGFHLAREIKARARMGRSTPAVLLLVAREQDDYLARWSEADAWVLKPVDPFDLAEAVRALVDGHPVPALPGVKSFAQLGAVEGAGHAGELPAPSTRQPAIREESR